MGNETFYWDDLRSFWATRKRMQYWYVFAYDEAFEPSASPAGASIKVQTLQECWSTNGKLAPKPFLIEHLWHEANVV